MPNDNHSAAGARLVRVTACSCDNPLDIIAIQMLSFSLKHNTLTVLCVLEKPSW